MVRLLWDTSINLIIHCIVVNTVRLTVSYHCMPGLRQYRRSVVDELVTRHALCEYVLNE